MTLWIRNSGLDVDLTVVKSKVLQKVVYSKLVTFTNEDDESSDTTTTTTLTQSLLCLGILRWIFGVFFVGFMYI